MYWRGVSSAQTKLWSVALFAIATLTAGVGWQLVHDRTAVINSAEFAAQQLALNLEAYVSGTLRAADFVADQVGMADLRLATEQRGVGNAALEQWQGTLLKRSFLRAIALLDPNGHVLGSVIRRRDGGFQVSHNARNLRDWSGFKTHLSGVSDTVHVAKPIRGVVADRWVIPVTRAVRGDDGELVGVVYVDIALDTFLTLFEEVLPLGRNSVSVYTKNGDLLFSQPFAEELIGTSFAHVDLFKFHLPENSEGVYEAVDPLNKDKGVFGYKMLMGWPLVLAVDLSHGEILAPWRQRVVFLGLAGLGASVVIFVLTLWLSLQFRQDEKTRKTLMLKERSLEESQRLAGVGHFERDILTGEITWAENMFVIHGVHADSFVPGRTAFLSLVVEESRSATQQQVYHFDFPPTNGHLECTIRRPSDGVVRELIYDWEIIHDHDGVAIKAFGVARDVTDLRVSESKARDNEVRLRDITQCMSDFIWETGKSGAITYFESGEDGLALDVEFGVTRSENVDMSAGGGDHAFLAQAMGRRESFRSLNVPLRNMRGAVRWARLSGNPRFDADGVFLGFRGAGADITEQREQRLFQSQKNKNDALDRLAGGIAHEINNLLQPVVVYSSMGETEIPETDRTQGYFKKIYTASQQAISIVQDILTFAREGRISPKAVPLAASLAEGLDIIRPTLPPTLSLVGPSGDSDLSVAANPGGLHQVLFNLVGNAVDAAGPKGHVSVEVGSTVLYPKDADRWTVLPGRYGYVSVVDNGPGMDEQSLSKVFDPFFTTKPRGVGTGLGLSVVAGLVREWGGAVEVKSKPGETVFTFYVPLAEVEQQAAE